MTPIFSKPLLGAVSRYAPLDASHACPVEPRYPSRCVHVGLVIGSLPVSVPSEKSSVTTTAWALGEPPRSRATNVALKMQHSTDQAYAISRMRADVFNIACSSALDKKRGLRSLPMKTVRPQ